jgi:hypothetical protein
MQGARTSAPASSTIELREAVGPVKATFRASRTKSGIVLHYEITNGSETDLAVKPRTVLVRANGRPVAFGMLRASVDPGRPEVISRGATEVGAIDIVKPGAREIELILALSPISTTIQQPPAVNTPVTPEAHADTAPSSLVPFVLQATFSGLDRLPISPLF